MPSTVPYSRAFYADIEDGARLSAQEVAPVLIDMLQPRNVVDVGCGNGAWLSVFKELGIKNILGIDGSYVEPQTLRIAPEEFLPMDLQRPGAINNIFDLVLSLEVAEHLPRECANDYLDLLTSLGDVIAFSAAIPNQGGTGHVNEQWPEYWKTLFEARGFRLVDCLRGRFWNNRNIERWYRQNLVLYVQENRLRASPDLLREQQNSAAPMLALVHPATYTSPSLSSLLHMLPGTLKRALRRRWQKIVR